MPGLFRNFRARALVGRRTVRYVLYGIGEIALIFIGITLAVAFENSAERRRAAALAAGLLLGVQQDLDANIAEIENNIRLDEAFLASVNVVLYHLDSPRGWNDSLSVELENALHWSSPFLSTSGYDGLKQAGLYQVPDDELRSSIVHLFETTYTFLVEDHDRAMWVFMESVLNPLLLSELRRTDAGGTRQGLVAPRDYQATRESGALRTALLEHQASLVFGLQLRQQALEETRALRSQIEGAARSVASPAGSL